MLAVSVALLMTTVELASVAHYDGLHWDIRSFAARAIQMAYRGPATFTMTRGPETISILPLLRTTNGWLDGLELFLCPVSPGFAYSCRFLRSFAVFFWR